MRVDAVYVDGVLDVEATLDETRSAVLARAASETANDDLIGTGVSALFDQYRGASLGMDFIVSAVTAKLWESNPELRDPSVSGKLAERIDAYMTANTNVSAREAHVTEKGRVIPARAEVTGRIYGMRQGRNGGHFRVADQQPATTK